MISSVTVFRSLARFVIFFAAFSVFPSVLKAATTEEILAKIPVQHGGRVKPFESFARETVLYITGKTRFEKTAPTLLVWQWMAKTDEWHNKPLLAVTDSALRKHFVSDTIHGRVAPSLVLSDLIFQKTVQAAQIKSDAKMPMSASEKASLELYHKARVFEDVAMGGAPGFIPHPGSAQTSWVPTNGILSNDGSLLLESFFPKELVDKTKNSLSHLLERLSQGDIKLSQSSAEFFSSALGELLASRDIILDESLLTYEWIYLTFRPFHTAWMLYLLSIVVWMFTGKRKNRRTEGIALGAYLLAFGIHTWGFVLRCLIAGRPPVTNMYESVIWVAWGVVLFALILWFIYRVQIIPVVSASVVVLALLISENLPAVLDQSISPLVPVLRNNFWLTIHVLTITLGYGAFLLNWGIAHVLLYFLALRSEKKKAITDLTEFLYRTLQIGIILLASGTILGGVWANYSWGRFWGWDPKETWALIALLAYLAVMHGRTAGWLDSFGVAFYSALCFLCVVMAWYGVNFVLAAGLHSYGFGGGGLHYVLIVVAADLLGLFFLRYRYLKPLTKIHG